MGYDTIRNDVDIQLWYEEATKAIPDIFAYYPQLIKASDHNLLVNESEQWKDIQKHHPRLEKKKKKVELLAHSCQIWWHPYTAISKDASGYGGSWSLRGSWLNLILWFKGPEMWSYLSLGVILSWQIDCTN